MQNSIIHTENVTYEYILRDDDGNVEGINTAVDKVSLDVKPGEFIAILGHNGSGKSTLAKHFNAILNPSEGEVVIDGMSTDDEDKIWEIRQTAGMVFQNPDNQIIGQIVEEDVGFGPENMGIPTAEIWERVNESLKCVGMEEFRLHSPNKLSGGQKQRVSIAGVLAMHPKCIILDEPTAMLDPNGRFEVIQAVRGLNDVEKITVILITHYMEEIVHADKVFVMDKGKVVMTGTPREIFSRVEELKALRLSVPQVTLIADKLRKCGVPIPAGILTRDELVKELILARSKGGFTINPDGLDEETEEAESTFAFAEKVTIEPKKEVVTGGFDKQIVLQNLTHEYAAGTNLAVKALNNISLSIKKGEFIGLIGHTGSGKSTLIQHLNGLLQPTSGEIYFDGRDIYEKDYNRKELRGKVGLVFQYPEHQLFEDTVLADVAFGPKNFGLAKNEAELKAFEALRATGLPEECYYRSPFDLSGGQKRRVAIAGVLAMHPEVLILDEPTAGLDPKGREEILSLIKNLQQTLDMTIILVSHSMEDVAEYVDRLLVMNKGSLAFDGTPGEVFENVEMLESMGLRAPEAVYTLAELKHQGFNVTNTSITVRDASEEIINAITQ